MIAAAMVVLIQTRFTALESGVTRAKNSINVAMKNITDFMLSVFAFFMWVTPLCLAIVSVTFLVAQDF